MSDSPRILVAGIGNIFLGDDAFGVHVAQRLMRRALPQGVRVADFGIRGLDLVYSLLDGCELAILIDAAPRGQTPGTLYLIEPQLPEHDDTDATPDLIQGHSMDPAKVLRLVCAMGGEVSRVLIVGCEPEPFDPDQDMPDGLSPRVAAAIEPAAEMVQLLVARHLRKTESPEVQHAS